MTRPIEVRIDPQFKSIFPAHSEEELQRLTSSVLDDAKHEDMPPIYIWNGIIVDGHTQYGIRKKHGMGIRYRELEFDRREDALLYAWEIQGSRRNLTASQLAVAFSELNIARPLVGRPALNSSQPTIAWSAVKVGVSPRLLATANQVTSRGVPALVESVKDGEFSATDAASLTKLPEAEQGRIIEQARAQGVTLKRALDAKNKANGKPIVDSMKAQIAKDTLGKLCRELRKIGFKESNLYDRHQDALNEMMIDLNALLDKPRFNVLNN